MLILMPLFDDGNDVGWCGGALGTGGDGGCDRGIPVRGAPAISREADRRVLVATSHDEAAD
jgi:hypothetical protein